MEENKYDELRNLILDLLDVYDLTYADMCGLFHELMVTIALNMRLNEE